MTLRTLEVHVTLGLLKTAVNILSNLHAPQLLHISLHLQLQGWWVERVPAHSFADLDVTRFPTLRWASVRLEGAAVGMLDQGQLEHVGKMLSPFRNVSSGKGLHVWLNSQASQKQQTSNRVPMV
jgi:hypothetical protein